MFDAEMASHGGDARINKTARRRQIRRSSFRQVLGGHEGQRDEAEMRGEKAGLDWEIFGWWFGEFANPRVGSLSGRLRRANPDLIDGWRYLVAHQSPAVTQVFYSSIYLPGTWTDVYSTTLLYRRPIMAHNTAKDIEGLQSPGGMEPGAQIPCLYLMTLALSASQP